MSPDEAKAASELWLAEYNLEINHALPTIEPATELSPQCADAVAKRAVVLSYIIGLGFGQSGERMKAPLIEYDLYQYASLNEQRLLNASNVGEQDSINCQWLVECVQSLGYCLGLVELNPFLHCDDDLATRFPDAFIDPGEFIASAVLVPFEHIYRQADLHYRLHWAARNSRLNGTECRVQEGLIAERRKALDWVIGVAQNWDEIPLDT